MPSNRLFPPLPELPLVDFACLRSFPFRDESSEPSVQPRSSTSSRTVKRIRSQAPTPSPTQTEHHQLPSGEAPKEETFALPPTVIDTLCTTIDGSFPWTAFAAEHNLDPTTLRAHINQQIFFPILSSSPSPIRELAARAENYRIVRSAVAAHISTRELSEARELREYEKMRDKERWQARKKAFKEEMGELERGWEGSKQQLVAAREGMKAAFRGEKGRRREEKVGKKGQWKRKEEGIEERARVALTED